MMACPDVNVNGIEDTEERETPRDSIDDDLLASGEELVDDGSQEKEMNEGPKDERAMNKKSVDPGKRCTRSKKPKAPA